MAKSWNQWTRVITIADAVAVNATATAYSDAFLLADGDQFSVEAICTGTSPELQIDVGYANEDSTTAPAYSDFAWVNWNGNAVTLASAFDSKSKAARSFIPIYGTYGMLKFTGTASNSADTTITVKLTKRNRSVL